MLVSGRLDDDDDSDDDKDDDDSGNDVDVEATEGLLDPRLPGADERELADVTRLRGYCDDDEEDSDRLTPPPPPPPPPPPAILTWSSRDIELSRPRTK